LRNHPDSREDKVAEVLRSDGRSFLPSNDLTLSPVQENVFRLECSGQSYLVKWVSDDDEVGRHEVAVNKNVLRNLQVRSPKLLFTGRAADGEVACWEWIDGTDLRTERRDLLPEAFAALGRFHLQQKHAGPVHSSYTSRDYRSVQELVADELAFHCWDPADQDQLQNRCASVLASLEAGYATFIHGDFHPGNVRFDGQNLFIVDWGLAHNSSNLIDLDYVQSVPLEHEGPRPWWCVGPEEAPAVLAAYAEAGELSHRSIVTAQRAVMLLAELRTRTNARTRNNSAGMTIARANIERLLNGT
jgi:Ser/Thr protein kinase RdoA (MazF antagonist)